MSAHKSWLRRLAKLDAGLPLPPAGAPYWLKSFEVIGAELGLTAREPDFATALAIYRKWQPPYGGVAAERSHGHLCELGRRALDGVPPCSVAEFAGLAAWLAANGAGLPGGAEWPPAIDVGDGTTVTLPDLTWRVQRGPTASGSGKAAETVRKLKARHGDGAAPPPGRVPARGWVPSAARDDGDAPGGP